MQKLGWYEGDPQDGGYGSPSEFIGPYAFALGGRFLGYEDGSCYHDDSPPCSGQFHVLDLRTGARRAELEVAGGGIVRDDVVTPAGSAAWIRETGAGVYHVLRLRGRRKTLLDVGTAIDPHSLVRKGQRVYWVDGATQKSALLK